MTQKNKCNILIVGVGGAGGNAVNNMMAKGLKDVRILIANTDAQALENSIVKEQILLGANSVTRGLGAGSDPLVGERAAEESLDEFLKYLDGVDMVFFTIGMGGGTGTGAGKVLAQAAKEMGKLVVAVVTTPFDFEGVKKQNIANQGISDLKDKLDTMIIIPNQNLFKISPMSTTLKKAFEDSDYVLYQTVKGITELITKAGLINLDFADVRSVMKDKGYAKVGFGSNLKNQDSQGLEDEDFTGVEEMINIAMNHPLLPDNLDSNNAKAIMLHITVGNSLTLEEVDIIAKRVSSQIYNKEVHFLFGATFDESMRNKEIQIFVITTGLNMIDKMETSVNKLMENYTPINELTNNLNDEKNSDDNLEENIFKKPQENINKKKSWFSGFNFFNKKKEEEKKKNNIADFLYNDDNE